jgi:hypothetical protein
MMISKSSLLSLLAVAGTTTEAFVPTSFVQKSTGASTSPFNLRASTIDETATVNGANNNKDELTTWECNDEAECVEVPACDEEQCRTSLDVRIHGEWYDLTGPYSNSHCQRQLVSSLFVWSVADFLTGFSPPEILP